jgi:hypothetical protein
VVRSTLRRALGGGVGAGLPVDDLAFAVSALFVGVELLGQTQEGRGDAAGLFTAFEGLARLGDLALRALPASLLSPATATVDDVPAEASATG